jgi:hypothetical protein
VLRGPAGHAIATVGLITAILAVTALVAGILTGTALAARAIQRRRAAAGGCTGCRFSCQHALTPAPRRPVLVGIYTRESAPSGPQWPHQQLSLTALEAGSGAGSGYLDAGASEHHDRARADGDLVAS